MTGFSHYWEDEILDHLFDKGVYVSPTIYVALSTADPGDDGTGVAEPSGGSFGRVETANADWTSASGGAIRNADAIEFPLATAAWGTITHFALYDSPLGGHLLACGPLTGAKTIVAGDIVRFLVGDLIITLD
jgi:hypothetical protein